MARQGPNWPGGAGEMARRIRAHHWSATSVGPIEQWPPLLRTTLTLILDHPLPMAIGWGPERIALYNDAYQALLGPGNDALGQPFQAMWKDAWSTIAPQISLALAGEASQLRESPLPSPRGGEPALFEHSYTPLRDEPGAVHGFLDTVVATPEPAPANPAMRESEEQQTFLLVLSDTLRTLSDPAAIQAAACRLVAQKVGAIRVDYAEIYGDENRPLWQDRMADGTPTAAGRFRPDSFTPAMIQAFHAGRTVAVADVESQPDLLPAQRAAYIASGARSFTSVPLVKERQLVAVVSALRATPSAWTDSERSLLEDAADRTWAATERARAEHALSESEKSLRLYVENVREYALVQTDLQGVVTRWNPGAQRLFGYSSAEIVGRSFATLLPEADRQNGFLDREMLKLSHDEKNIDAHAVQRKDGSQFWAEWVTEPVHNDAGVLQGTAKVMRDETERQNAKLALERSERRLRTILEGIPQLVWRALEEGQWIWSSPQWQRFTGQTLEQSRNLGWLDVIHPDDRSHTMAAWRAAPQKGFFEVEHRIRRASDGAYVWHQTRSVRSAMSDDMLLEWLGTSTDVAAAKKADAEKEALLKEVHHRVKNNLQVITSLVNLQSKQITDEQVRSQFDETRNRVLSIASIHEMLYDSESLAEIDLAGYAEHLSADLVQFYGLGDRVQVQVSGEGTRIELERAVPYGLLVNELTSNALKHAFPDGQTGRLRISIVQNGAEVRLLVQDDGIGLPEGFRVREAHSLGMHLIHAFAEQLGGTINYLPGSGTAAEVSFPARSE